MVWVPKLCALMAFFCTVVYSAPPLERPKENELPKEKGLPKQIMPPAKSVKKMPKLVQQPDHLEGVPLEKDGHLNRNFIKETFLGVDSVPVEKTEVADQFEHDAHKKLPKDMEEPDTKLRKVFLKADKNSDKKLSSQEMVDLIMETTERHLDEAVQESKKVFQLIDHDNDGLLTWEEYHVHFLVDKNLMDEKSARNHDEAAHANMDLDHQERMEQDKEEWGQADADGQEGLSQQEFLHFRHPEHSDRMLRVMVADILKTLDKNGDGRLSEMEFAAVPPGELEKEPEFQAQEKAFIEERKKEFRDAIDADKDGWVTLEELLGYSNPRNPQHARSEVRDLLEIADTDQDGSLSLDEILAHKALFLGSGLVNPGRNMHDEF